MDAESCLDCHNASGFLLKGNLGTISFHLWRWFNVLLVGYDDDAQCIYILDCGRKEVQTLTDSELCHAWNCSYPGLSKPNTICTVRMNAAKKTYQIAKEALDQKGEMFLNPPVRFVGRKEFPIIHTGVAQTEKRAAKDDYDKILTNIETFFGTVPTDPNALRGKQKAGRSELWRWL